MFRHYTAVPTGVPHPKILPALFSLFRFIGVPGLSRSQLRGRLEMASRCAILHGRAISPGDQSGSVAEPTCWLE
jgi:hypothetical protein